MEPHDELGTWRRQWQTQGAVPPDLRKRVSVDIRRRRLALIASVAVTVVMGGGTTLWAVTSQFPGTLLLLVGVWTFIALTWTVALILERKRGPWNPSAETTAAFVEFSIRSCRVRLQGLHAAAILSLAFVTFMLAWRYGAAASESGVGPWTYLTSARVVVILAITVVLAVAGLWWRKLLLRELQALERARRQLRAPES